MSSNFNLGAQDFEQGIDRYKGKSFFELDEEGKQYFHGWVWAKARRSIANALRAETPVRHETDKKPSN